MNYRRRRDLLAAMFWWCALIFTIAFWWIVGAFLYSAFAHDARPTAAQPNGWRYDVGCCSSLDCQEISEEAVHETPNGYVIVLRKQDHIMLVKDTTYELSYTDSRIKPSPDGEFHACISRQFAASGENTTGGNLICFYVPPKGM